MASLIASPRSVAGNDFGAITLDSQHIILNFRDTNTGNFSTFTEWNGATGGFQVPTGKELWIVSYTLQASAATQSIGFIGWGDNDVGQNSVFAPVNSVNSISGGTLASGASHFNYTFAAIGDTKVFPTSIKVPATKYPAIYFSVGGSLHGYFYCKIV